MSVRGAGVEYLTVLCYHPCLVFLFLEYYRGQWSLLQGIPNMVVYIDDTLVMGATEQEHLNFGESVDPLGKSWLEAEENYSQMEFVTGHVVVYIRP